VLHRVGVAQRAPPFQADCLSTSYVMQGQLLVEIWVTVRVIAGSGSGWRQLWIRHCSAGCSDCWTVKQSAGKLMLGGGTVAVSCANADVYMCPASPNDAVERRCCSPQSSATIKGYGFLWFT